MRSNLLGNYFLTASNLLLPIVTAPLVAHQLSLSSFGKYSILQVIGIYLSAFIDFGISTYGTREISKMSNADEKIKFWRKSISIRMTASIVFLPIFCILALYIMKSFSLILFMSLLFVSLAGISNSLWMINAISLMSGYTINGLLVRAISALLTVACSTLTRDPIAVFAASSFGGVLFSVSAFVYLRKHILVDFLADFDELGKSISKCWYFAYSNFLSLVLNNSIVLFSGLTLGASAAAGISVNDRIVKGLLAIASPFTTSTFPSVSETFASDFKKGVEKLFKHLVTLLTIYTIVCLIVYFNADRILGIFGSNYVSFKSILILMLLWSWLGVFNNFVPMQYLFSVGREKTYSKIFTFSAIVTISGYIILPRFFDIKALPVAALIGESIATLCGIYILLSNILSQRKTK